MNFEQEYLSYDELEINIGRMLCGIKKHLKVVIILSVLMTVILSVLVYKVDLKNTQKTIEREQIVVTEADYSAVKHYEILKSRVDFWEEYRENSPALNMDCYDVYKTNIQYYIDAEENVAKDISAAIFGYMSTPDFKNQFAKELNLENLSYVDELYVVNMPSIDDGIINIDIVAKSATEGTHYVSEVESLLKDYSIELVDLIGVHDLVLLKKSNEVGFSEIIYDLQSEYITNYTKDLNNLQNYKVTLTKQQNYLISGEEIPDEIELPVFSIKYILVAFVIASVISVALTMIYTLFDGRLQSELELRKRFNFMKLGVIKKQIGNEQYELMSACISKMVQNCETDKVGIISTVDVLSEEKLNNLYQLLEEDGIGCELIGDIAENKEALLKLSKLKPTIIVEKVGKSKVKEIYREVSICNELSKEIIGYICIAE